MNKFNGDISVSNIIKRLIRAPETDDCEYQQHIESLNKIGNALSTDVDLTNVFDLILSMAINYTNADGATIYMVSKDGKKLDFKLIYNKSLGIDQLDRQQDNEWPSIPLFNPDGSPRTDSLEAYVFHNKITLDLDDVYESANQYKNGVVISDISHGYRCKSMLTIPLLDHENNVLGLIQVINAIDADGMIVSFDDRDKELLKSLASQAALAVSHRNLLEGMETLLMQFMRVIATAIERKSTYSSRHISRVVKLTEMLAQEINKAQSGVYKDISFTADQLRELSMAALTHDLGKIVTPKYIIDKSTRLFCVLDKIDLVQLRFSRMKLLCRLLKESMNTEDFADFIQASFGTQVPVKGLENWLDKQFEWLRQINETEEYLSEEVLDRVQTLADIHITYDGEEYYLLSPDEKLNLKVRQGTLNPEERKLMREHVWITLELLSQLSFPKKYQNVANIAASHHENLLGTGYPRGLKAEQLSIQSRILAMADIFEAITASDRPYKTPHTLSESLIILAKAVRKGKLDGDLMDIFLDSGLYMVYARDSLEAELIDNIDVNQIKNIYHI